MRLLPFAALCNRLKLKRGFERQHVGQRAEARDRPPRPHADIAFPAEFLTRMGVRQVNLDEGNPDGQQGISQPDAGMSKSCRVETEDSSTSMMRS